MIQNDLEAAGAPGHGAEEMAEERRRHNLLNEKG
jgi:hypothetical protein